MWVNRQRLGSLTVVRRILPLLTPLLLSSGNGDEKEGIGGQRDCFEAVPQDNSSKCRGSVTRRKMVGLWG